MCKAYFWKGALFVLFIGALLFLAVSLFLIGKEKIGKEGLADKVSFEKDRVRLKNLIRYFPFSKENSTKEWEEKILKGRVIYIVEKGGKFSYVRAKSEKAASALYYKVKLDIDRFPLLNWKWRVDKFPKRNLPESIEGTKEEDFAARVYVIFPAVFFTNSKVIEYIWSETLPPSTSGTSGYSKNIKVLVLEKGKAADWLSEKRDVYRDYEKLFGERPKLDVGAIAFMTDADSTKTSADAAYDEIQIGYR